jgi:hypothetical protein
LPTSADSPGAAPPVTAAAPSALPRRLRPRAVASRPRRAVTRGRSRAGPGRPAAPDHPALSHEAHPGRAPARQAGLLPPQSHSIPLKKLIISARQSHSCASSYHTQESDPHIFCYLERAPRLPPRLGRASDPAASNRLRSLTPIYSPLLHRALLPPGLARLASTCGRSRAVCGRRRMICPPCLTKPHLASRPGRAPARQAGLLPPQSHTIPIIKLTISARRSHSLASSYHTQESVPHIIC